MLALQDDFAASCFEAACIDALVGAGLEAFEANRHRDTEEVGTQCLELFVVQSLKIVTTHTFSSGEYGYRCRVSCTPDPRISRRGADARKAGYGFSSVGSQDPIRSPRLLGVAYHEGFTETASAGGHRAAPLEAIFCLGRKRLRRFRYSLSGRFHS